MNLPSDFSCRLTALVCNTIWTTPMMQSVSRISIVMTYDELSLTEFFSTCEDEIVGLVADTSIVKGLRFDLRADEPRSVP